jgi:hypothetical protein
MFLGSDNGGRTTAVLTASSPAARGFTYTRLPIYATYSSVSVCIPSASTSL